MKWIEETRKFQIFQNKLKNNLDTINTNTKYVHVPHSGVMDEKYLN